MIDVLLTLLVSFLFSEFWNLLFFLLSSFLFFSFLVLLFLIFLGYFFSCVGFFHLARFVLSWRRSLLFLRFGCRLGFFGAGGWLFCCLLWWCDFLTLSKVVAHWKQVELSQVRLPLIWWARKALKALYNVHHFIAHLALVEFYLKRSFLFFLRTVKDIDLFTQREEWILNEFDLVWSQLLVLMGVKVCDWVACIVQLSTLLKHLDKF